MRGETRISAATRFEVVTEGILVRMLQQDPELSEVSIIILDEFHERNLQADLALALLLDVQSSLRDDLRLLVMSATLDNEQLLSLLPQAEVITAEGRAFPVERRYQPLSAHQPLSVRWPGRCYSCISRRKALCWCFCRDRRKSAGYRSN